MARKNESDQAPPSGKALVALKSLRAHIDKVDLQILKLANERATLASEIGKIKTDQGTEVFSPAREEEVLHNVLESNKGPLDETTVRAVFREIMSGSRACRRSSRSPISGLNIAIAISLPWSALGKTLNICASAASPRSSRR